MEHSLLVSEKGAEYRKSNNNSVLIGLQNLDIKTLAGCSAEKAQCKVEAVDGIFRSFSRESPWGNSDYLANRVNGHLKNGIVVTVETRLS